MMCGPTRDSDYFLGADCSARRQPTRLVVVRRVLVAANAIVVRKPDCTALDDGNSRGPTNARRTPKLREKTRCGNQRQIAPSVRSFLMVGAHMLIGYVRVSKSDGSQTLSPQRDALLAAGVGPKRIYEDLASGRSDARPGLAACLKALQPGDTLMLWKLDRLGRDLRHLVNTVEDLRVRGIGLKVLTGAGAQIDTTTANGRLAFGIFAAFAEFERELIAERTQAGLAAARARGRPVAARARWIGRHCRWRWRRCRTRRPVAAEVAKRLGLTTTTLYTYVNGDGSPKAAGQALLDGQPRDGGPKMPTGNLAYDRFAAAASIAAMSIFLIVIMASKARFAAARPGRSSSGRAAARRDLPGEAPAVLAPAAGALLAAVADDRVPVTVGLFLVFGEDHEAHRFVRLEIRAAIQADERPPKDGEFDGEFLALLPTRKIAGSRVHPPTWLSGKSRRRTRPPCVLLRGRTTGR